MFRQGVFPFYREEVTRMTDVLEFLLDSSSVSPIRVRAGGGRQWAPVRPDVEVLTIDPETMSPILSAVTGWYSCPTQNSVSVAFGKKSSLRVCAESKSVFTISTDNLTFEAVRPADAVGRLAPQIIDSGLPVRLEVEPGPGGKLKDAVPLGRDAGLLIGLMVGDGWVVTSGGKFQGIAFAKNTRKYPEVMNAFLKVLRAVYDVQVNVHSVENFDSWGESMTHRISGPGAARFFRLAIGNKAEGKHIPVFAALAPREFREGLLLGMLSSDGSVSLSGAKTKKQLMGSYSTSSQRLVHEFIHLCHTLGISANETAPRSVRGKPHWGITLSSPAVQQWNPELIKQNHARALREAPAAEVGKDDVVPMSASLALAVRTELGSIDDKSAYVVLSKTRTRGRLSRSVAQRVLGRLPGSFRHPHLERFRTVVAATHLRWVEVSKVTAEERGHQTVYGFATSRGTGFQLYNGLVLPTTPDVPDFVDKPSCEEFNRYSLAEVVDMNSLED